MKRLVAMVMTVLLCTGAAPGGADVCTRVLLRALSFDRNFEQRVGQEAVLLVAYNSRDAESMDTLDESRAERARLAGTRLGGAVLRIVEVDLRTMSSWEDVVEDVEPDAVMLLPGTEVWRADITTMAHQKYITLGHGWDADGMAISVSLGADDRPNITVDRAVAGSLGMDLSSQLLRLAVLR